ncbi:MAG: phosphoribosylanthranilate isomerase [Sediminibacterium sp.]
MKIKVCGITNIDEALALSKAGVNYVGFIFYPASKRYALHALTLDQIKTVQLPGVLKVGVFVNEPLNDVIATATAAGLDMVQLHGDETPNYCKEMANHYPVIKAFRISETDDVAYKISEYLEDIDYLLFDTASSVYGGSGISFDWTKLANATGQKPYFLSGGIGPDDVSKITSFVQSDAAGNCTALDVNSKFETAPGQKNIQLLQSFIPTIKAL